MKRLKLYIRNIYIKRILHISYLNKHIDMENNRLPSDFTALK